MNLEFGCGNSLKKGFVGCDIRQLDKVKYVCNAWDITKYVKPKTVKEIFSHQFLEHLSFSEMDKTLTAWHEILVPKGMVQIIVPDIDYHIKQFLEPDWSKSSEHSATGTVIEHALKSIWGWQRGDWDLHKSGYNFRLLQRKLKEHFFYKIKRLRSKPWNLDVRCWK